MGGKVWSWYLANKLRAHLTSFLTGLLIVLVAGLVCFWYLRDKENVVPLLAPLASLLTGLFTVGVAWFAAHIALQQTKTARERHEAQAALFQPSGYGKLMAFS